VGSPILRRSRSFVATQRECEAANDLDSLRIRLRGGGLGSFNWNYSVCVITGSGIREISNNNYSIQLEIENISDAAGE